MLFLSLLPFVFFCFLLLGLKKTLFTTSLYTLILIFFEVTFIWKTPLIYLVSSANKGFFLALDILFIIFGALVFLSILSSNHVLDSLITHLELISRDIRIQTILLAWFLENFLEGTAGFGTPSTVVAPILISLGLTPLSAVIISLLGNSAAVAFGAAGTPIRIGFAGLDYSGVLGHTALYNFVGLLVPVFILWSLVSNFPDKKQRFLEALPFAVWSGFCFSLSSWFMSFLGQEFPSILGSVMGLALVLFTNKLGIFVPKNTMVLKKSKKTFKLLSLPKTLMPYILLIIGLILGKIYLAPNSLYLPFFNYRLSLFNPGFVFLLVSIPSAIMTSSLSALPSSLKSSFIKSLEPFLVIVFMSIMVQLMVNSGQNPIQIPSLINHIALIFQNSFLPFTSPLVGAFGSFITGSATISNLMFGNFMYNAASNLSMPTNQILALLLVGASAGNMTALADILTAETVVGLRQHERQVIKGVLIPCLVYIFLVGIFGLITVK